MGLVGKAISMYLGRIARVQRWLIKMYVSLYRHTHTRKTGACAALIPVLWLRVYVGQGQDFRVQKAAAVPTVAQGGIWNASEASASA